MKRSLTVTILALALMAGSCVVSDTTIPVVTIVVPANNAVLAPGTIVIKAIATDNKAMARVEFYAGATKIGEDATGTADTFDVSWTVSAEGAYALKAKAWDKSDNTAEHSIAVTIQVGGGGTGPTNHTEDIVGGDSVWYPSGNPHIVKNRIDIRENGKLTIKPGCVVKFDAGASFVVGHGGTAGELQAVGTTDSIITFTSNAATPNPGDWEGFDFYEGTRTSSRLSHCVIDYGGFDNYGAVNFDFNGVVKFDHNTIRNAPKYGIWSNYPAGYPEDFTGNTITACGGHPLYLYPENLHELQGGNTLTGNARNAIYVRSGTVSENGTWKNHGVPYFLSGDLHIHDAGGANLTIEPGTIIQLGTGCAISVGNDYPGGLKADSVTFTTVATSPQRGDWEGLWFYERCTDAECQLTDCVIEYGGGDGYGNIWIEDAVPTITGCHIAHSGSWGIYLDGSQYPDPDALENDNTFNDNVSGNVRRP